MSRLHNGISASGRYRVLRSVRHLRAGEELTLPQGIADAILRRNGGPYIEAIGTPQAKAKPAKKKVKRVRKNDAADAASSTDD